MDVWQLPGFEEIRELGRGGFGRVMMAREQRSGAPVAIKYLNGERVGDDPRLLAQFRAEATAMRRVQDPHVARLYDWVESPAGAAIVMELVDGVSLADVLKTHGATTPEAALAVLKGSLLGLSAAHAAGVVHRDYKPANVIVRGDGASVLIDFGIAAPAGEPGTPAGTPAYMAPEQWEGVPASPASDVYAATCVFFECVSGRRPYQGAGSMAMRAQHTAAPIPVEQVPEPLRALVGWGMAKHAGQRPTDLRLFLRELESVAVTGYGPDWEQRGVRALAMATAALAGLFPLAATMVGGQAAGGGAGAVAHGAAGHGIASGGTTAKAAAGKAAAGKIGVGGKAAMGVAGAAVAAGAAGFVYVNAGDSEPPPPPHYTLQELRGAFLAPAAMGGGYESKDERSSDFPVCSDKDASFPGKPKTASRNLRSSSDDGPPKPVVHEWAAEYPDAESARRAFEQLKRTATCPSSRHVPREELGGNRYEPAHNLKWRRRPGKVLGWTQSRAIIRKDYLGTEEETTTVHTVRDFLLRGNGLYVVQYIRFAEPEKPETIATKPAAQLVNRLLNNLP